MLNESPRILPINKASGYRNNVLTKNRFSWIVTYKNSDIFLSSDKDVSPEIASPLTGFYDAVDSAISVDKSFLTSLRPIKVRKDYPPIAARMCRATSVFDVGPMAAVAGAACEAIADHLINFCTKLVIENGGDTLIFSEDDPVIGLYVKNNYFKDRIKVKARSIGGRISVCSSSSTFGHSYSEGKCDLAAVFSGSAIYADAAATAVANSVRTEDDIDTSIKAFSKMSPITGIMIIKNKKIGLWGNIELMGNS